MVVISLSDRELKAVILESVQEILTNFFREQEGKKLLTQKEAAKQLKVTPSTLRSYVKRGLIPEPTIGGTPRYRQADIDNAIKTIHKYGIN